MGEIRVTNRTRTTAARLIALAIASSVSGVSFGANEPLPADPVITDPDIGAIMSGLRSRDFHERERASIELQRMVETNRVTESELVALARRSDITPEQRTRILDQAMLRFKQTERAGMGIGWRPVARWGAILTEVRSNFPVAQHLAMGDIIQSIDGMSLIAPDGRTETWDLISIIRTAIISRDPGDSVRVVFRRPPAGEVIDAADLQRPVPEIDATNWEVRTVDVPLASFSRLAPGNALSQPELEAAWIQRLGRLLPADEAAWSPVRVTRSVAPDFDVPDSIRDNQVSSLTGRSTLRDRVFMTRQYNANNRQTFIARAAVPAQRVQMKTSAEAAQTGFGAASPLNADDGLDLESIAAIDTEVRLIEQQIAQIVANGAPQELIDELRARHRELCDRLADLAKRQPTR